MNSGGPILRLVPVGDVGRMLAGGVRVADPGAAGLVVGRLLAVEAGDGPRAIRVTSVQAGGGPGKWLVTASAGPELMAELRAAPSMIEVACGG